MRLSNHWLFTWTTYGTWLPGDARGFVSGIRDPDGKRHIHNLTGEPCLSNMPALQRYAKSRMKGDRVLLNSSQARTLLAQFQETAKHRSLVLHAVAIMANHIHLVCSATDEHNASTLLKYFKSYGSRCLNTHHGERRWWTVSGSVRRLPDTRGLENAIEYVMRQHKPLLVWRNEESD